MANTVIQIKRSNATASPSAGSLAAAEPAYSFNSDKLFLGNTAGTGVIEVGGKFYVDMTQNAYAQANAAYVAANNAASGTTVVAAFGTANLAYAQANTAYDQANTALLYAEPALFTANAAIITANAAYNQANTARTHGNAAFLQANTVSTNLSAANTFLQGYADTAESDAKIYANSTFVKLTSPSQTITGNLSITGSLIVSGNTYIISAEELRVADPLIYLAGNNYISDIVDIGFIANYVNATGSNVHTGLYREHVDKEWYLFQGYDAEPANNHIGAFSNNMTLAMLNADLRTSNLILGGANAILTIGAAFDKANAANLLAFNTGAGANAYAQAVGTAGNNYTITVGAAANGWANTISATRADASNAYARTVGDAANTASRDASRINTGTLAVAYGGTGVGTFTQNGILYGNTASALKVTSAGTEGQVLQASSTGVPLFAMLDGGSF